MQRAEIRYQKIEQLTFALVVIAWRLQPYFLGHHIIVMTEHLIRQVLRKLDLVGRIIE